VITERLFKAMGTVARVIVVADHAERADHDRLLDQAEARIEQLESRWSRFRPDSELCRLNAAAGHAAVVSRETFELVTRAVDAWFLTSGRFDPTILPALVHAGYDRTFEDIEWTPDRHGIDLVGGPRLTPGCAEIILGHGTHSVSLPVGVQLDLGGIGKGYAADLVAAELLAAGAEGACVSIGGDMRCMGRPPWDEGWFVEIDDPFAAAANGDDPADAEPLMRLALTEGAVVTTTRTKRAWVRDGRPAHHIIDPATGAPARTGLAAVTVLAAEAWWGEVFAKAAFLAGPVDGPDVLAKADVSGFLVDDGGEVHRVCRLEAFAW
jgi:thiamine biosynthesis lipoprotein